MTAMQIAALVAVMAIVTFLTRALPFLLFGRGGEPPQVVLLFSFFHLNMLLFLNLVLVLFLLLFLVQLLFLHEHLVQDLYQ